MSPLRFTLVSEGSSDRALLPVLEWAIRQCRAVDLEPQWAELRSLPNPPRSLADRVRIALELYPCELLFVHRDGDRAGREARLREIKDALATLAEPPAVCVVPVRALEAWFLFDEAAIRRAAGNPNGRRALDLPAWRDVEALADPKGVLWNVVQAASELEGRRRRAVEVGRAVHRIADLVTDFSPLRRLPAFASFETDLREVLLQLAC
ncbi:MAG: hypothetical protein HC897_00625 [Thermoanaerobaculia bacterium]|nr:hypothetical protein [Thermoanaerobaculia bacterium]